MTSRAMRALIEGSAQADVLPLFAGGVKEAQVWRSLIFPRRHEIAFVVHEVILLADHDVVVVLGAVILEPHDIAVAAIALVDRPWPREGIVDDGDDIVHDVRIGLVERNLLLDDGLIVLAQWDAAEFHRPRTLEVAGLDLERVEAAITIGIRPFADRI